jgi:hypothetical protein
MPSQKGWPEFTVIDVTIYQSNKPNAMNKLTIFLCLCLMEGVSYSQHRPNPDSLLFRAATHSKNLKSTANPYNGKSFYQSKSDWQTIIDTTWGRGLPLNEKLIIFNAYTKALTDKFEGFKSLGIDPAEWDSIKAFYHSRIDTSTSKGAFAALMSRLAYNLHDCHAFALDTTVLFKPLNPGTPILVITGVSPINHFGAVLTLLPDSALLVLRSIDNHPLGLQPGDIVLGYEGIPWKDLVDELLAAGIPMLAQSRGAKSASRYNELVSAGMNWHLFETIDIVKYANGDTLHLPVYPLKDLPIPASSGWKDLIINNEQLRIPGVPFPDPAEFDKKSVYSGIIEGTNIGYVYLLSENYEVTDRQFFEAVRSLLGTEGIIIDMRFNSGGWTTFNAGFALLFNRQQYTLDDAIRCLQPDFSLCPTGSTREELRIHGNPMSWYDRPLAILTGPNCISDGDITAYRLGYHPMARFFGKSTCASLSFNEGITDFMGWALNYPIGDMYQVNRPAIFLNRHEFPVDDPVWFDRDGAANGEDAVVKKAVEWIQNLAYAHEAKVHPAYISTGTEVVTMTSKIENPSEHDVAVKALITSMDSTVSETVSFLDDGDHEDGEAGDGIWGAVWQVPDMKTIFSADLSIEDPAAGTTRKITSAVRFTTIGPIAVDGITYTGGDTIPNAGDIIEFKVVLRNNDLTAPLVNIRTKLTSLDTSLAKTSDISLEFADMAPGEISTNKGFLSFYISIDGDCPPNTSIPVSVEISRDNYTFWTDTITFLVLDEPSNIEEINTMAARVYPNPAEDKINIEIGNAGAQETIIELVSVTGTVIYRKECRNNQGHFTGQIDVSGYARGLYFVRIRHSGAIYVGKIVVR